MVAVGALMWSAVGLQGCDLFVVRPAMPDLSGTYIAHSANIQAEEKTVNQIMSSFKQAEEALRRGDLDGVMDLYAEFYKYHGFTKVTLQSVWRDLLQNHHDFSTTHVFSMIKVEADRIPPTAQITCTGSLWAISNQTGQRVNIDSWFGEVHYMVYENGRWRIRGHAWETPMVEKEMRFARPPHPFF
jgi:hypothetical protein